MYLINNSNKIALAIFWYFWPNLDFFNIIICYRLLFICNGDEILEINYISNSIDRDLSESIELVINIYT